MRAVPLLLLAATPAAAQDHAMHHMPGMTMPMPAPPAPKKPQVVRKRAAKAPLHPHKPAAAPSAPPTTMPEMPGMPMPAAPAADTSAAMPGMVMPEGQHAMPIPEAAPAALPVGNAPAPPAPRDHFADRQFDPAAMHRARAEMMQETGAQRYGQILLNLAEYRSRSGYRWDGEGWFGGDIDRLAIKSEGSGNGDRVEAAEAQVLFAHAIDPYFNLEAGLRHDFTRGTRTYATIGVEGLAPYRLQTAAALFVSDRGEVLARAEGWYDQRLTQRLVLQPRVELNLAAQDTPETRTGAGLDDAELGLRLRYEITRRFAPYLGISHDAKAGRTARFARRAGEDAARTSFVAGVRFWF